MGLIVDRPARMDIYHPKTGQPLVTTEGAPCWVDLLSIDSEAAQKFERELNNRRLSLRVRTAVKAEDMEAEQVERLAVVTAGWCLAGLDGAPVAVDCNRANAKELYGEPAMRWLREQVERFLGDRANFTPDSAKS